MELKYFIMVRAHTIENIRATFEAAGCQLLTEEYKNKTTRLEYICNCGNTKKQKICYNTFVKGVRCIECQNRKRIMVQNANNMAKYGLKGKTLYNIDKVREIFEKEGCKLVSTVYQGNKKPLEYMCSCGSKDIHKVNLNNFLTGRRCKDCIRQRTKETIIEKYGYSNPLENADKDQVRRYKYEDVKEYFRKYDCELISDKFENCHQKLKVKFKCGHIGDIRFDDFRSGHRCGEKECYLLKATETFIKNHIDIINATDPNINHPMQLQQYKKKCTASFIRNHIDIINATDPTISHPMQLQIYKDKVSETFTKNHIDIIGPIESKICYPSQLQIYKDKSIETTRKRYGVDYYAQSKECKERIIETFRKKYGTDYYSQTDEYKEKMKNTIFNRYGVEHYFQSKDFKAKATNTNITRYGVPICSQNKEIMEKIIQTNLERYNCKCTLTNPEIRQKAKDRILSIYGVDNVARSLDVQEKKKITSREKYGCDYPLQNPDIISKIKRSSYMSKIYKFSSGKTTLIQGFENFALDYLLNELKFVEYDIMTNELEMPQFIYFEDCKYRRYFPDIYIPKENLFIEVKSEFTFGIDNHQIFTKCKTVKYNGYNMWLMIFGKKGELLKWIVF